MKQIQNNIVKYVKEVAPYVGAWIETFDCLKDVLSFIKSHPTWVRGLKLRVLSCPV